MNSKHGASGRVSGSEKMAYRWKPSSSDKAAYAAACKEIAEKGLKLSKSTKGLSIYGEKDGKRWRVSNHQLPEHYYRDFDEEKICKNQKEVFAFWGVEL